MSYNNGVKRGRSPSPVNGAAKRVNTGYGSSGQTYSGSDVKSRNPPVSAVAGTRMDPSSIAGLPATPVSAARTEDGQLKDAGNTAAPMSQSAAPGEDPAVPSINIKALIVTQDASIIIGKGAQQPIASMYTQLIRLMQPDRTSKRSARKQERKLAFQNKSQVV